MCKYLILVFGLIIFMKNDGFTQPLSSVFGGQKAQNTEGSFSTADALGQGFQTPPDSVKPWVYWYWINDNISKEGITKDLEAMARVGIGEAFIGNIGLEEIPAGKIPVLSEAYWEAMHHAVKEGRRVGVDIGVFNSPGWSQSGGPWVKPSQAMRYMKSVEITARGGQKIHQKPPFEASPKYPIETVIALAFPDNTPQLVGITNEKPTITANLPFELANNLTDGDAASACTFPTDTANTPLILDITFPRPIAAQSLNLYPAKHAFSADCVLQMMDKNGNYTPIQQFRFDRSNLGIGVGFMPYTPVCMAFPEAKSSKFRLILRNVRDQANRKTKTVLADIYLSETPQLERYVEKQLAKMHPTPLPLWGEYQWKNQAEPTTTTGVVSPEKVINLTKFLAADGTLTWKTPKKGNWRIVFIGVTPTGTENGPTAPHGRGLEVDKMDKIPLGGHFDGYVGKLLNRLTPDEKKALRHVVADSYEMGSQNWTNDLPAIFQKQYGYDALPYLPVLSGRIVGNADKSNRFLWDLRRLIADRVAYEYVGGLRQLSEKNGMKVWLENYGHWGFPGEFLQYGGQANDIAGEFWNEGELGNIECKAASSAAHIYGKNQVWAESFTAAGKHFERYPAYLKKRGDWSFTEGINHTLLHVYIHQPYEDKNPGINAWFGTEFNRKNTWFEQSATWIMYLRRCMYMLQRGKPVADVAYFIGEDAPKMTGIRDPELPKGYDFDYINAEVILNRLSVKEGRLVLPDGLSYRLLVLPKLETMRPEVLTKIKQLVAEGATILGNAPKRSPSLVGYPSVDAQIQTMSTELWGKTSEKVRNYGKGKVLNGMDLKEVFALLQVSPDFSLPTKQPVLFTHRTGVEGDIYFISNQSDSTININPTFRIKEREAEFWDATTGAMRPLTATKKGENGTTIPLRLEAAQSLFVVFRPSKTTENTVYTEGSPKVNNFPEATVLMTLNAPWQVEFDKNQRGTEGVQIFEKLEDWSINANPNIQNYSGTAVYRTRFMADKPTKGSHLFLHLGKVSVMAKVKVNGKKVGGLWTAPWQVDVTEAVQTGENTLEIEVVNTWFNRLVGDAQLPEKERPTWLTVNTFKPSMKRLQSGLLGPVTLQSVSYEP